VAGIGTYTLMCGCKSTAPCEMHYRKIESLRLSLWRCWTVDRTRECIELESFKVPWDALMGSLEYMVRRDAMVGIHRGVVLAIPHESIARDVAWVVEDDR